MDNYGEFGKRLKMMLSSQKLTVVQPKTGFGENRNQLIVQTTPLLISHPSARVAHDHVREP